MKKYWKKAVLVLFILLFILPTLFTFAPIPTERLITIGIISNESSFYQEVKVNGEIRIIELLERLNINYTLEEGKLKCLLESLCVTENTSWNIYHFKDTSVVQLSLNDSIAEGNVIFILEEIKSKVG
ncbi:MAG: hypothetical protein QW507_01025 [Candidatus Nanoarchaeia archaeon]|nr:hypothetical protein [Candidatus Haiyanarchaeum thermophilum]MCW1303397.1 hypothetical protein [Candidatus Haiyanarchaeum thermophilum]MCW1303916.1 hypothetical protein [Candidatus Haiyanarchaeum thermophilum]MCW1306759.1 hypothetical protein [Candidatus Haiyanarchaeum thermophilum]MCW1307423.1 hypothetical protein [Candidatus Haiyanarchaeum thermophilum]